MDVPHCQFCGCNCLGCLSEDIHCEICHCNCRGWCFDALRNRNIEVKQLKDENEKLRAANASLRDNLANLRLNNLLNANPTNLHDLGTGFGMSEVAFVGLINQGRTCYINSFLQSLFHIPMFRKAVYDTRDRSAVVRALKILFRSLQVGGSSVSTKKLTKSLDIDVSEEQDVHEFSILFRERMPGALRDSIDKLYEGIRTTWIKCTNVPYENGQTTPFYDLQLDVKGHLNVYDSFDKLVRPVNREKKVETPKDGLQDAIEYVTFMSLPKVLQLHLIRFKWTRRIATATKINDSYEYYLQLNLRKYLPDNIPDVDCIYTLHSVLVHSGVVGAGHYFAYIRPTIGDDWFLFNDESVTKVDAAMALGQIGGNEKTASAYMLVYIRESDRAEVMRRVDVPQKLMENEVRSQRPYCSCTGKKIFCNKSRGWKSRCCTLFHSGFPLPKKMEGRTISFKKFEKLVQNLKEQGKDTSCPIDLKDHWLSR